MSTSFSLAPEPLWTIINNDGGVAGGAYLYTYRQLNKVVQKPTYTDWTGANAWDNPLIFDMNGTHKPIYWQVDSAAPTDTYYIEAWTSDKDVPSSGAQLLWTVENFAPTSGAGGGGGTTYINTENYIANNTFIEHASVTTYASTPTNWVMAPGNHKGFTPALVNPIVGTYGVLGPDARFVKKNSNATDAITFETWALGSAPLTGDVTPVEYVRYVCSNSPSGEDFKCFQFPVCQKVQNLSGQTMTFIVWAAVTASPVDIEVFVRQYYGSGTASTGDTRTSIGTRTLSTTWTKYVFDCPIPSVGGGSLGTAGQQTDDDALYIQLEMPHGAPCDVLFTKPALYLGAVNPAQDFQDYDQLQSVTQGPRTGDVKASWLATSPPGWLSMNDGTIGNTGSGATTAAGAFTFQLYKTLWDSVSNTYAPVSGGRGATAQADFIAGKTLTMPKSLGRAMCGAGSGSGLPVYALGQNTGAVSTSVSLVAGNLPAHNHTYQFPSSTSLAAGGVSVNAGTGSGTATSGGPTDPPTPFSVATVQPSSFYNIFIKL